MVDANVECTWVGSMDIRFAGPCNHGVQPSYKGRSFPTRHEGHWGWRVNQIVSNILVWLKSYQCSPTCTLMYLGVNDANSGQSTDSTARELTHLINLLKSVTNTTVLLAVPFPWCHSSAVSLLTPEILSIVNADSRVFVV